MSRWIHQKSVGRVHQSVLDFQATWYVIDERSPKHIGHVDRVGLLGVLDIYSSTYFHAFAI